MHLIADIRIQHKAELYEKLNAAVAAAHGDALGNRRHGVLVTRHDYVHFSVFLTSEVPYGLTREHDERWRCRRQRFHPQALRMRPLLLDGWPARRRLPDSAR